MPSLISVPMLPMKFAGSCCPIVGLKNKPGNRASKKPGIRYMGVAETLTNRNALPNPPRQHIPTVSNNSRKNLLLIQIWCKFASKWISMARQSISFTKPNDEWLKSQLDNQEYSSKSELINDLIRQARKQQAQIDWIRAKLEKSERSGFTDSTKEQILKQSKSLLNG